MLSPVVSDNMCKLLLWGYEQHISCLHLTTSFLLFLLLAQ